MNKMRISTKIESIKKNRTEILDLKNTNGKFQKYAEIKHTLEQLWPKEEITWEIRKYEYIKTNGNKNTTYQNLWEEAKAVLRGEFTVVNAYIKKEEEISNQQPNLTS